MRSTIIATAIITAAIFTAGYVLGEMSGVLPPVASGTTSPPTATAAEYWPADVRLNAVTAFEQPHVFLLRATTNRRLVQLGLSDPLVD
jgi:hypothetical protein